MLKNSLSFLILLLSYSAFSQSGKPFDNNDPKLNAAEAQWLNEHAATPGFDFQNKKIDFIHVEPGYWGIGKDYFHYSKKKLFPANATGYLYKVIVLDSSERVTTKGYDALLIFSLKRHQRKFKNSNKAEALEFSRNRYPQIPEDAGTDNNSRLSAANAEFFNQVFANKNYLEPFDFRDKKVLLIETDYFGGMPKFISIKHYVQQVKNELYRLPVFHGGDVYVLNEAQRQQSGGYDVVVNILNTKKGIDLNYLLQFLEQK